MKIIIHMMKKTILTVNNGYQIGDIGYYQYFVKDGIKTVFSTGSAVINFVSKHLVLLIPIALTFIVLAITTLKKSKRSVT